MKRLGVCAFIAILLAFGLGSAISPQKAFAFSSTDPGKEQVMQWSEHYFTEKLMALQNEVNSQGARHGKGDPARAAEYAEFLETNKATADAVRKARRAFEDTFLKAEGTDKLASLVYGDALLAAGMSLSSDKETNPILKRPYASNFIELYRTELMREYEKKENISAIRDGKPLSQEAQNASLATKGAANPTKPPADCEVWSWTITGCIDAAFTWLIKNTLLQIAGFLVWLTANMLNYAIQISILDFAKWAPGTLYPVWVTIRQIVSLFVVFAGLWLGFMYIIGDETKFGKYVGWLVIFALFVNFSYPFSRALVDISNIVSLNVYSAAVGPETLTGSTGNTAGSLIMNRLGLQGLVGSATEVKDSKTKGVVDSINSTPGALIALAFVLYAAYIFFMATAIIAVRTAVLVFLIVASPLLLVDSVIPKLGDAAVKMRKLFFEQLIVAPVFMIMLALTLKFMDIFQTGANAPLGKVSAGTLTGAAGSIQTFFSILMMLIMLHIMIKVTKSISGQAGEYATGLMGKVGGFGLGVATGGAGLLARGSIGAAAARMRDSDWMRNAQDSKIGRGMHGLTNSLAQSTFDTRNIGMVKTGMAKAGLTSIGGIGMGAGTKNGYDDDFKVKSQKIQAKSSYIKDAGVRERYLDQMTNTVGARAQRGLLKAVGLKGEKDKFGREKDNRNDAEIIRDKIMKDRNKILDRYNAYQDQDKQREFLESQPDDIRKFLRKEGVPVFKDAVPAGTAPVQSRVDVETGAPLASPAEGKPYTTKKTTGADGIDTSELDKAGLVPKDQEVPASTSPANENQAPSYAVKGAVVPHGGITFNFNGVAHQSFTAAVKQAEKAKETTAATPAAAQNQQSAQAVTA